MAVKIYSRLDMTLLMSEIYISENKELVDFLDKVKVIVVDHAAVMGKLCNSMEYDFYGCLAHFFSL